MDVMIAFAFKKGYLWILGHLQTANLVKPCGGVKFTRIVYGKETCFLRVNPCEGGNPFQVILLLKIYTGKLPGFYWVSTLVLGGTFKDTLDWNLW